MRQVAVRNRIIHEQVSRTATVEFLSIFVLVEEVLDCQCVNPH